MEKTYYDPSLPHFISTKDPATAARAARLKPRYPDGTAFGDAYAVNLETGECHVYVMENGRPAVKDRQLVTAIVERDFDLFDRVSKQLLYSCRH